MTRRWVAAGIAAAMGVGVPAVWAGTTNGQAGARSAPPVVIAVVGEPDPLNVLHSDFRTRDGRDAVLPAGMPRAVRVTLPTRGSFAQRLAQVARGPLGHLRADTLYYVAGTRLLVYAPKRADGRWVSDAVSGDRLHSTGVVDAAVGLRHGTDPDALALFVAGSGAEPWQWIASQRWVDVVTTSSYGTSTVSSSSSSSSSAARESRLCEGAATVRQIVASGRMVFSSSGNTSDEGEPAWSPNGLPEVYQVGGVDAHGRTWLPGHSEESDPWFAAGTVMRPYDTGELFSFAAAGPDTLTGTVHFGGTSGATPRTAGWAARLIAEARRLTGSDGGSRSYTDGRRLPRGPLSDGRLDGGELRTLLRHVAVPAEPAGPERYYLEGYGALNVEAIGRAVEVLRGTRPEPRRPQEDAAAATAAQVRGALFNDGRCAV